MNNFELEIWDDEGKACTFYTVRQKDCELSEMDRFLEKYKKGQFKRSVEELLSFILTTIGDTHGALEIFFNRDENEVTGLPSRGSVRKDGVDYCFTGFDLRLYALKISDRIVILFNGGVKDGRTNQSSSLLPKWREACQYARVITKGLDDGIISINHANWTITSSNGSAIMEF